MSDAARDLYSFLRSKDFIPSEEDGDPSRDDASGDDAQNAGLRAVDSFSDVDETAEGSSAKGSNAEGPNGESDASVDALEFDDDNLGDKLRRCSEDRLHDAPFGVVQVDDDGVVQFYNEYESNLSGVDPEKAVGRNFFTQLAPCSNNRIFLGRFKKGVRSGEMDERFNYTFTYKMRPTLVDIRLYRDDAGNNWIMVRKR